MKTYFLGLFILVFLVGHSQTDSLPLHRNIETPKDTIIHLKDSVSPSLDTSLRIIDLNPYFTLHVDSTLSYQLQINKNPRDYFWYLKNAPLGLRINKDNGTISFRADRSYFLSGRLKYDVNYKVNVGFQNLHDPKERIDTNFTIVFFNTEVIPSKVKPTVSGTVWIDE